MAWSIRYLVCIRVAAVSSRIALPTPDTSNSRGGVQVAMPMVVDAQR